MTVSFYDSAFLTLKKSLDYSNKVMASSMESISTGLRVNSASDDPAGFVLAKGYDTKISSLTTANNNISYALNKMDIYGTSIEAAVDLFTQMRSLAVSASSTTISESLRLSYQSQAMDMLKSAESSINEANSEMGADEINIFTQLDEEEAIAQGYTLIETADDLKTIDTTNLGGKYILMNDIDMSEFSENNSVINGTFTGELNGNGYSISNLTINSSSAYTGLIYEANGATIENIALENVDISDGIVVGALAGRAMNGTTITNSRSSGSVSTINTTVVGGLVGILWDSTIQYSSSSANVTGAGTTGGLVGSAGGDSVNSAILKSYATGTVEGGDNTGGLVGSLSAEDTTPYIEDSYATGDVTGNDNVGGLVGEVGGDEYSGLVRRSYATGDVEGGFTVGGLAGFVEDSAIQGSYATGDVTASDDYSGGLVGLLRDSSISGSFSSGTVDGYDSVGGFVGQIEGAVTSITNSHTISYASGNLDVGGFVGMVVGGSINSTNYWNTDIMATGVGFGSASAQGVDTAAISALALPQEAWSDTVWDKSVDDHVLKRYTMPAYSTIDIDLQAGHKVGDTFTMSNLGIGMEDFNGIDLTSSETARAAINEIDEALEYLLGKSSNTGATQNLMSSIVSNNTNKIIQYTNAAGTIRDADVAYETAQLTTAQIQQETALTLMGQLSQMQASMVSTLLYSNYNPAYYM